MYRVTEKGQAYLAVTEATLHTDLTCTTCGAPAFGAAVDATRRPACLDHASAGYQLGVLWAAARAYHEAVRAGVDLARHDAELARVLEATAPDFIKARNNAE